MKKMLLIISILVVCAVSSVADTPTNIVAVKRSGAEELITVADICTTSVLIGPATEAFPVSDPVETFRGLTYLPNLTELGIVIFPQISSYEFLDELPGLTKLTISLCRLEDMSFLSSLPELKFLIIDSCLQPDGTSPVGETLDLGGNPKLETVSIVGSNVARLPALRNAPVGLRLVDFSSNNLKIGENDIEALESYASVESLVLNAAEIAASVRANYENIVQTY